MKTDILGVAFDALTLDEAEERADALLRSGAGGYIVTANPEIVLHCREDAAYAAAVNGAAPGPAGGGGGLFVARVLGCLFYTHGAAAEKGGVGGGGRGVRE